jgi:hypothetical protein
MTTHNTYTENRTQEMKDKAKEATERGKELRDEMTRGAKESTTRLTDQTRDAWNEAKKEPTPKGLMGAVESLPSSAYLYGSLGAIGLSALLRIAGRKEFANFVGLWPPTILSLAMLNKMLRPSKEM